jgi:hypothetical protein
MKTTGKLNTGVCESPASRAAFLRRNAIDGPAAFIDWLHSRPDSKPLKMSPLDWLWLMTDQSTPTHHLDFASNATANMVGAILAYKCLDCRVRTFTRVIQFASFLASKRVDIRRIVANTTSALYGMTRQCPRLWTTNRCACAICIAANSMINDTALSLSMLNLFWAGHETIGVLGFVPIIAARLQTMNAVLSMWRTARTYPQVAFPIVFAHLLRRVIAINCLNDECAQWIESNAMEVIWALTAIVSTEEMLRSSFETLKLVDAITTQSLDSNPSERCRHALNELKGVVGVLTRDAHQLFDRRSSTLLYNEADLLAFYGGAVDA